MAELGTAVPTGGAAPAPPIPPAERPTSTLAQAGWGVVSTLLLFGFLALSWGWAAAAAGLIGLFVHEGGHMLVINRLGYGPSRLRIIPFLGAAATMAKTPRTAFHGVVIAMAGPIAGLISAVPFIAAAQVTHDRRWMDGATFIILINVLNLLPAPPLDGSKALGPALARIHPLVERGVLALIGAAAAYFAIRQGSFLFGAFIGIATLGSIRRTWRPQAARPLSLVESIASIVLWVGVLAAGAYAFAYLLGIGGWSDAPVAVHSSGF